MVKPTAGEVVVLETKDDFDAFLKEAASTLVVVDFYADWCGPCKLIAPKITAMAVEFSGKAYFAKVNVDENSEVAEIEGISAMPTFKLYKNGKKVDELTGANETKLREKIVSNI
ncbi:thioredoxin-like [Porites lutea]|uniref:thioredoxin-like n=1 Tax=Porites lutea TaxID=51062 RepID=UPI003CC5EE3D